MRKEAIREVIQDSAVEDNKKLVAKNRELKEIIQQLLRVGRLEEFLFFDHKQAEEFEKIIIKAKTLSL